MSKTSFLYESIISYRYKIFKIILFELFYSLVYFKKDQKNFKEPHIHPCPYYFNYKLSKFINKREIKKVVELGCGFGRITNFLADNTHSKIFGYELDLEAFKSAYKSKFQNVSIKHCDILKINYNRNKFDAYILNDPFFQPNKKNIKIYKNLIQKIYKSKKNSKKKYYIIAINFIEKKRKVFLRYNLVKKISAGPGRNINIYCN